MNGHPDAFTNKVFVFSGVLDSLYRDQAKDLVLRHGGRVTGGHQHQHCRHCRQLLFTQPEKATAAHQQRGFWFEICLQDLLLVMCGF